MRWGLSLFLLALASACARVPPPSPPELALSEIDAPQLMAHLRFLSHDLLEGRAPSTRGGQLAAEYLATQLALLGFAPGAADGTYFQQVAVVESAVKPSFVLSVGDGEPFTYLQDVVAFSGVQDARLEAGGELVFVGHGIVAPEYRWNDYEGVDVKGKVVLIMVNDPPATTDEPGLFGGSALTYYGRWTYKFEEAARQGAAGALLIHTDESATYPWQVVQSSWSGTQYSLPAVPGQPALKLKAWVTNAAAIEIARRAGQDLEALRAAARTRGTRPVPFGVRAETTLVQSVALKASPNVIGVLKGADPSRAVVYTAHYDHFGIRARRLGDTADTDRIFNGAIDNASGVAGTLEIAQAFARTALTPARSIYVVFTTAEESGLLGAEYFAARPVMPAAQWLATINIDSLNMAGRTKDIVLLGAERSTLGPLAQRLAASHGRVVGPDPDPGGGRFFRSDHFPLAKVGIPAVSLAAPQDYVGQGPSYANQIRDDYNNTDYHQASDEYHDTWDVTGALEDMRVLTELGWAIANGTDVPTYHQGQQFARPRQAASAP
ncbi:MAG TPA: M20/M25/M40 family metallo-hydrolase [Vicinamibacterales bacterium]